MERFQTVSGPAAPLLRRDVDTDIIIRIERLTGLPKDQLGQYAFEVWRGPDFVLDREPFIGAPILIAGANFGCGSSREAAVWALQGLGLRVVIAPSFGEIFMSNCFQNGVLPVVLPEQQVANLAEQARSGAAVTADLDACVITAPDGTSFPFQVDPVRREMLIEGADEMSLTLRRQDLIRQWQTDDARRRPWVYVGSRSAK
ncbi:3-isopropylmalate/(R)-2-methylmalate dehydratase small subunit [Paraburkholderia sp. BL18I3N2]|uniref:3-isopropylmalate dehydratase small subunit n=1 Tax=Paraburkholderia sp. BL18I3N2 TaxID=1938799 RepID=UPI000D048317|nr:3-isopropylmalate dehydratase small subunit [Paraburkholderia sp. BL18I3N2]PRX24149.1 3-isopropylmalate/(R)-2-methylmalate dehydratase small subunit [Paraburkholderia sp. BL18I3N2]